MLMVNREMCYAVRLLTEAQLMEELGVARLTLQRWRKQGMPYVALGVRAVRYNLLEVMEWLEGRKTACRAIKGQSEGKEVIT